jgi:hypothetical protein
LSGPTATLMARASEHHNHNHNHNQEQEQTMSEDTPAAVQHADTASEAIRSINHLTWGTVPAPLAQLH